MKNYTSPCHPLELAWTIGSGLVVAVALVIGGREAAGYPASMFRRLEGRP